MAEKLCELKKKGISGDSYSAIFFQAYASSSDSTARYNVAFFDKQTPANSFNEFSDKAAGYTFENTFMKYTRSGGHNVTINIKKTCIIAEGSYGSTTGYRSYTRYQANSTWTTTQGYAHNPLIIFD